MRRNILLLLAAASLLQPILLHSQTRSTGPRDATKFPGASIVEQIQAALRDCGFDPCEVQIPAGTYNASPISTWKNKDESGSSLGVALPSNVEIRGAGRGHTIIKVARSATDPQAVLFANANRSNKNIHLSDMTVTWTDASQTYDWVSIFICHRCEQLELNGLSLEGNPNKLVNLLDSTGSSVHDNDFLVRTTGHGHGDNGLSVNRFDSSALVGSVAGVVRDNHFAEIGLLGCSMLVVTQSGLQVHSNFFEAHLPGPDTPNGIETGQDNPGRLAENVTISDNTFFGASIAHGGLNDSEITRNFFDHGDIYVALQDGTTASLSGLTIADNELHFGSIGIAGLEHVFTGRLLITRNRVFDGNIRTGASMIVRDIEVSDNQVRYAANMSGIDCYACSVIRGNVVRDSGQNAPGYLISGGVQDVSDNVYIDEQHDYNAGTICTVPKPSSTVCVPPPSRGTSRWILLQGGEWGFGWTNRTLVTDRGNFRIRAFLSSSVLELEENAQDKNTPIFPAGTRYHLSHSAFIGFGLNNTAIERFANNMAISAQGFRQAAVQENGTVRVRSLSGNFFHPYSCNGKCALDYRSTVTAPD